MLLRAETEAELRKKLEPIPPARLASQRLGQPNIAECAEAGPVRYREDAREIVEFWAIQG